MYVSHNPGGGCVCVLNSGKPGHYCDNYITAEDIPNSGGLHRVEVVKSGHVRHRVNVRPEVAPDTIFRLAREWAIR